MDSMERADLSGKLMYRNEVLKQYNRIEIQLSPDRVLLNGQEIEPSVLEEKVYGFILKYTPDYVIVLNIDEEISYGRYIEHMDLICYQVERLRNQLAAELYGNLDNH